MGIEIERKFLVKELVIHPKVVTLYRQGYLPTAKGTTIRVRTAGEKAFLTIKGPAIGFTRKEYEYPIPIIDAEELFGMCVGYIVEKIRYGVYENGLLWEVDEFRRENEGLIVAEIELKSEDQNIEPLPDWVGQEVTSDSRYSNLALSQKPYRQWSRNTLGVSKLL